MRSVVTTIGLLLCVHVQPVMSQETFSPADTYYPTESHFYSYPEGLPSRCIAGAVQDSTGKLFLAMCIGLPGMENMRIFSYDGQRAYPTSFRHEARYENLSFYEVGRDGMFTGRITTRDSTGMAYYSEFIYNPYVDTFHIYPAIRRDSPLFFDHKASANGRTFGMKNDGDLISVWEIDAAGYPGEKLFEVPAEKSLAPVYELGANSQVVIVAHVGEVLVFDLAQHKLTAYDYPLTGKEAKAAIYAGPGDSLWVQMHFMSLVLWDPQARKLIVNPFVRHGWKPEEIIEERVTYDRSGNALISYKHVNGMRQGYLLTTTGALYDYTQIVMLEMGEGTERDRGFLSEDFTRDVMIVGDGFQYVQVMRGRVVETLPRIANPRSIAELRNGDIAIYNFRTLNIWDGKIMSTVRDPTGLYWIDYVEMSIDRNDRLWGTVRDFTFARYLKGNNYLAWYDPHHDTYELFLAGQVDCMILDNQETIYYLSDGFLFRFNPETKSTQKLSEIRDTSAVTQMFVDSNGDIWLATSEGLKKFHAQEKRFELITLEIQAGIQRIHEDRAGIFWLGTLNQGLIRYDRTSGTSTVINRAHGLLNNIVPSILEDNNGNIWAGTYDGINVLSPDGVIIGKVTEDDGLIANECNRWSQRKLRDGRLAFGGITGVSIIDANAWTAQNARKRNPRIYLTELYSKIPGSAHLKEDFEARSKRGEQIILPADNRNLQVNFGLSNYSAPQNNVFAYKIDREGEDWQYIGNQRTLSLNSLSPGAYNIYVRGTDGSGRWSDPPIVIPLRVKDYFYKQWWFYALCSMPFLAFLGLWIYRQRQEKKHLEEEVVKRTATIREQATRLEELDHVKSQLYTNITHEFRTPLTVIMGMAERLKSKSADPAIIEGTDAIERNSANLLNLVNQMLDLRKLESGTLPLHLIQDDIVRFLRYLSESVRSLAEAKEIHYRFLSDVEKLSMDFDPMKLRQVIANLLSNAIKFTPHGGEIYLQLHHEMRDSGEHAIISVRDTGIGIPEDKLPFIFERFYQVDDSSTRKGEGTGIGLTISSEMTKLMGGQLTVTSKPGEGSMFTLRLPVTNMADHAEDMEHHVPTPLMSSAMAPRRINVENNGTGDTPLPSVLVVEDNADVVHYLATCLRDQYAVLIATNGQEGIDKAIDEIPDLIVSDVMMPLRDGFDLCHTLKEDERTSHIPIILLTAKADADSRLTGLKRGADDYLSKPFHQEELLVRIEQLILLRQKLRERYSTGNVVLQPNETWDTEDAFVAKFRDVILRNIDDEMLDANRLSHAMAVSRTQLHRKIKALTGQSTMEFLKTIRIAEARKLLMDPQHNISEVSYATGFKYPETFTRAFQEVTGMSPSEWRTANMSLTSTQRNT